MTTSNLKGFRFLLMIQGLAFTAGFTGMSAIASSRFTSNLLSSLGVTVMMLGPMLMLVAALANIGVVRWTLKLFRVKLAPKTIRYIAVYASLISLVAIGIGCALNFIPYVGPVLGSIWFLIGGGTSGSAFGWILYICYSAGICLPFILTSIISGLAAGALQRMGELTFVTSMLLGICLLFFTAICASLAIVDGTHLSANEINDVKYTWESQLLPQVSGAAQSFFDIPFFTQVRIAFSTGLIAFMDVQIICWFLAYLFYMLGLATAGSRFSNREQFT